MPAPADRFDEVRRRWIARHQHSFTFQKRRAEILARRIRDRATEKSGARVDPADDDVIHPLIMRPANTVYAGVDLAIVLTAAVLAPVGWPLGKAVHHAVVTLIPGQLRSYPIAAFMWATVSVGLPLPLVYTPTESLTGTVVLPWMIAQIPAALLAAGCYGIVEGWLAVDGSRDWWPMRTPRERDEVDFGLQADDMTMPGIFDTSPDDPPGERMPIKRYSHGV